jgi:hypothetical protein
MRIEDIAMQGPAINWARSNCTAPKVVKDLSRFLFDANAAGVNCWFLIGGGLVRSGIPSLVHWFGRELFVFQLSDAQAAIRGVDRQTMCVGRGHVPAMETQSPEYPAISLNRLELLGQTLPQTEPLVGHLYYQVLANGSGPWCVRLEYGIENQYRKAWCYPRTTMLFGNGMIDVTFSPITLEPAMAVPFKGPLALFARLFKMSPLGQPDSDSPISNTVATLVDVE